ncbi:hypothetical protein AURDEDRAFT_159374 [Auricularia subglabra TFB-10046 SS5]|nr:hypothetical protein AURDEDRAFT_159374 [Auricularia subglabra TFB-10046 SS5]
MSAALDPAPLAFHRPLLSKYVFIDQQVYGRPEERAKRSYFEYLLTHHLAAKITKWPYLAHYIVVDAKRSYLDDDFLESGAQIVRHKYFKVMHARRAWPDIKRYLVDPTSRVPFPTIARHDGESTPVLPPLCAPANVSKVSAPHVPAPSHTTLSLLPAPQEAPPRSPPAHTTTSPQSLVVHTTQENNSNSTPPHVPPCPLPSCILPTNRYAFQHEPVREWGLRFMEWASKYAMDNTKDELVFAKAYINKVSSLMSRIVSLFLTSQLVLHSHISSSFLLFQVCPGVWTSTVHSATVVRPQYKESLRLRAQKGRDEALAAGIPHLNPRELSQLLQTAKAAYREAVHGRTLPALVSNKVTMSDLDSPPSPQRAKDTATTAPAAVHPGSHRKPAPRTVKLPAGNKTTPSKKTVVPYDSDGYQSSSRTHSPPPTTGVTTRTRAVETEGAGSSRIHSAMTGTTGKRKAPLSDASPTSQVAQPHAKKSRSDKKYASLPVPLISGTHSQHSLQVTLGHGDPSSLNFPYSRFLIYHAQ